MHALLRSVFIPLVSLSGLVALTACGGGGSPAPDAAPAATSAPSSSGLAVAAPPAAASTPPARTARVAAATATAGSADNDCAAIRPFYWELGDREGASASGSVEHDGITHRVSADTRLTLASASKWLYAAYVAQRRAGALEPWDVRMLTARSGYISFSGCRSGQSVDECLAWQNNDRLTPEAEGRFYYSGGHDQKHASLIGLGALDREGLAAEWQAALGAELDFTMAQARPGGGAVGTSATYARFLRKLLRGDLALAGLLGSSAACAQPSACPAGEALYAPATSGQNWHYSLGHWVEDDPVLGDGSFSSAGGTGFYPWVDSGKTLYGIVAQDVAPGAADDGAGAASARCGRLIRQAWKTGVATL